MYCFSTDSRRKTCCDVVVTQHDESVDEEVLEIVPPRSEGLLRGAVTQDLGDQRISQAGHDDKEERMQIATPFLWLSNQQTCGRKNR